jgi:hypothetical protein
MLILALGTAAAAALLAPRGGSIALGLGGPTASIERGPRALVALAYAPPTWLPKALVVVMGLVVAIAAIGVHRNGGVDEDVIREMNRIGATAIGAIVVAKLLADAGTSYLVIVLGAGTVPWATVHGLVLIARRLQDSESNDALETAAEDN